MTRSPIVTPVTPAPTLSTMPANSAPGENGKVGLYWYLPAMISRSKKLSADRGDCDHSLARSGYRIGQIGDGQIVRRARACAEQGFHGRFPVCSCGTNAGRTGGTIQAGVRPFGLPIVDIAHYFAIVRLICNIGAAHFPARGQMTLNRRNRFALPLLLAAIGLPVGGRGATWLAGDVAGPVSPTGAPTRRHPADARFASHCPSRRHRRTIHRTAAPRPTSSTCSSPHGRRRR